MTTWATDCVGILFDSFLLPTARAGSVKTAKVHVARARAACMVQAYVKYSGKECTGVWHWHELSVRCITLFT